MTYSPQITVRFSFSTGYKRYPGYVLLGLLLTTAGCKDDVRTIHVRTQPSGATVFIDGKLAGAAPCKVQWKDARPEDLWELHVIEAKTKGYESQRREIRYRTGEAWLPERLELTLNPTGVATTQPDESDSTPSAQKITWTPKKEIITANNKPPTQEPPVKETSAQEPSVEESPAEETPAEEPIAQEPPQTQPASPDPTIPPESPFTIWRPKGRPATTTEESPPSPVVNPLHPDREYVQTLDAPAETVAEPADEQGFQTSGPNRLMACEVRLVRLSDGRVLGQASLLGPYSRHTEMADVLVKLLAKNAPDDAAVAVGCLSNRRREPAGRTVCDEMTRAMIQAVRQTPGLRYVKQVNLRDVILDEEMIESPKIIADRRIAHLFTGADHVIVGGTAMAVPIAAPLNDQ